MESVAEYTIVVSMSPFPSACMVSVVMMVSETIGLVLAFLIVSGAGIGFCP